MSSVTMLSLTDSEVVTGRCDLGVVSTCERRAGTWQHSAARSASWSESVATCCTCSHKAAVDVDEVGAENLSAEGVVQSIAGIKKSGIWSQRTVS